MTRRILLAMTCPGVTAPVVPWTVSEGGQAPMVIALADATALEETEAAPELFTYLGRFTGAALEVVPGASLGAQRAIFLGATRAAGQRTHGGIRSYLPLEVGQHSPSRPTTTIPDRLNIQREPALKRPLRSSVSNFDPKLPKRSLLVGKDMLPDEVAWLDNCSVNVVHRIGSE